MVRSHRRRVWHGPERPITTARADNQFDCLERSCASSHFLAFELVFNAQSRRGARVGEYEDARKRSSDNDSFEILWVFSDGSQSFSDCSPSARPRKTLTGGRPFTYAAIAGSMSSINKSPKTRWAAARRRRRTACQVASAGSMTSGPIVDPATPGDEIR
jgi:hypothetical protein